MTRYSMSRRAVTFGALGLIAMTAACGNGVGNENARALDARVNAALDEMYGRYPNTRDIANSASGMLVMPLMTEAGFWLGGGYGRGALISKGETLDYYSAIQGSAGLQAGAQQYSYVVFFMTDEALNTFRTSNGWEAAADAGATLVDEGASFKATSATLSSPVLLAVFGQAGAFAGATVEGIKYTRIIP
ncbi:MAG: lipid-binding SYLF domain-containing protein [Rhodobacteraceae bacterium]|nr:lipid-binding SYLF domain-containing protein [Paracoccaceae bacterium]